MQSGAEAAHVASGGINIRTLLKDPPAIWGRTAQDIADAFGTAGYSTTVRGSLRGSRASTIVEISEHPSINQIQVHPGGGRHGGAYYKICNRSRPGGTVHRDDAHLCLADEVALALSDEELCYMKAGRREGVIWIIAEAAQPVP